jgi:hypothetical protein
LRWLLRSMDRFAVVSDSWKSGFSVRHDWQDGTHDLVGFHISVDAALRAQRKAEAYWQAGPWRPRCSVVVVSRRDQVLHKLGRDCRSPDCPMTASMVWAAR